jgi:hypothetical protein
MGSQMAVGSELRAGRPLPPRKIHGTHFCLRLSGPQGHSAAVRIRDQLKNPLTSSEIEYKNVVIYF